MANVTTNVEALADLKLDVSEPAGPIGVGDEVVYALGVRIRGSKAAEAVGVVAYFSEGIELVSRKAGERYFERRGRLPLTADRRRRRRGDAQNQSPPDRSGKLVSVPRWSAAAGHKARRAQR